MDHNLLHMAYGIGYRELDATYYTHHHTIHDANGLAARFIGNLKKITSEQPEVIQTKL